MPRDVRPPPAAGGATPIVSSKHKTPATLKAGAQVLGRQLSLMQDATQRLCAISATHLETCAEQLDLANERYSAASALAAEHSGGSEDVRKHESTSRSTSRICGVSVFPLALRIAPSRILPKSSTS